MEANYVVVVAAGRIDALYSGASLHDALRVLGVFLLFVPDAHATLYAYDLATLRDMGAILRVRGGRWSVPTPAALKAVQQPRTAA